MTGPFRWNAAAARYVDAQGRFVSRAEVRAALDFALENSQREMIVVAEQFRAGQISLEVWREGMAQLLKEIHLYSGATARGGFAQMTPADYGRVGQQLRRQYEYLNNFTTEIVAEIQPLDGRFISRVKMYAQSGRVTFTRADLALQIDAGMTERRNILHPAEHCDDCLAMRALGWVAVDDTEYIPIGDRQCLTFDKCSEEFR